MLVLELRDVYSGIAGYIELRFWGWPPRATAGTWTNPGGKSAERRLRGFKVMPVLCFSTPVRENYFAPQNGTHLINSGTPVSGKRVDHMIRLVGA